VDWKDSDSANREWSLGVAVELGTCDDCKEPVGLNVDNCYYTFDTDHECVVCVRCYEYEGS